MVAVVSSLVFVVAIGAALYVIATMIAGERGRILGLLEGSTRAVPLPRAIRVREPRRAVRARPAFVPGLAALRAAA